MTGVSLSTDWFAEAVQNHSQVVSAAAQPSGFVAIQRKGLSEINVAPVNDPRIDAAIVRAVLQLGTPTEIVLISKIGHYDWDARDLAEEKGSTIHTFKELYSSMSDEDPRPFLDKNVSFVRDRLDQHSKVLGTAMICEASMQVIRKGDLDNVICAVEYEYEFSEEALVRSIGRHPDADVIVNANPNGNPTTAALAHAQNAQTPLLSFKDLMGAVNFSGKAFREYGLSGHDG